MVDEKLIMLSDEKLWSDNIQKSINKGISPLKLGPFTDGEIRAVLLRYIERGEYHVAPPHIALIPKENGKIRKVFVNMPLDRLILGCINDVYYKLYSDQIHPKCLSYQKGVSVHNIIQKLINQNWLGCQADESIGYKVDIHAYFDSVKREEVNKALLELNTDSALDKILWEYYNTDIVINEDDQVIKHYKSLAQGCAFGTFLANYVLRDVDEEVGNMVPVYYRYSDDILIMGPNKEAALEKLINMLEEKGLELNPKKIEKIYPDRWFTFLGFRICGDRVSFSEKSLKTLCKEIEELTLKVGKQKRCGCTKEEVKSAVKKINNKLFYSYEQNHKVFGWAEYFFRTINVVEDIETIDFWIRDCLRAMYTGHLKVGGLGVDNGKAQKRRGISRGIGKNVTANKIKTGEQFLKECGYLSIRHLYKLYRIDKDLYKAYLRKEVYG